MAETHHYEAKAEDAKAAAAEAKEDNHVHNNDESDLRRYLVRENMIKMEIFDGMA